MRRVSSRLTAAWPLPSRANMRNLAVDSPGFIKEATGTLSRPCASRTPYDSRSASCSKLPDFSSTSINPRSSWAR
ncbi:MAG: hypothetical protein BWZ02_01401 [Lentisphaerae bacterium ADurb.BinA184]|nr:MAG: hypothetical protein BWZ02_01401 [Lentisphaerae bacterium ADurb.BinA184]